MYSDGLNGDYDYDAIKYLHMHILRQIKIDFLQYKEVVRKILLGKKK